MTLGTLEEEMVISWNGPKVQHSDEIVKETLDGSGTWHLHEIAAVATS